MKKYLFLLILLPTLSFAQKKPTLPDSIKEVPMKLQSWSIREIEANRERLKQLEPYLTAARQLEARNQEIILDVVRERQAVDLSTLVDFSLPAGTDTVRLYVKKPKAVKKP